MKIPKLRLIFTFVILVSPMCSLGTDEFNQNKLNRYIESSSSGNTEAEAGTSSVITPVTISEVEEDPEIKEIERRIQMVQDEKHKLTERYAQMKSNTANIYHIKSLENEIKHLNVQLIRKKNAREGKREMSSTEIKEELEQEYTRKFNQDMRVGLEIELRNATEKVKVLERSFGERLDKRKRKKLEDAKEYRKMIEDRLKKRMNIFKKD